MALTPGTALDWKEGPWFFISSLQPPASSLAPCLLASICLVSAGTFQGQMNDILPSARKPRGDNPMFHKRPAALCGRVISVNLLLQRITS